MVEPGNFFQSENEATLRFVRPYEIHGARFVEIGFSFPQDPEHSIRKARISNNLIYSNPAPGDVVRIAILMGNVTRVTRVEP